MARLLSPASISLGFALQTRRTHQHQTHQRDRIAFGFYKKLNADNRAQAVSVALSFGLT
jgi:hypothetical protein